MYWYGQASRQKPIGQCGCDALQVLQSELLNMTLEGLPNLRSPLEALQIPTSIFEMLETQQLIPPELLSAIIDFWEKGPIPVCGPGKSTFLYRKC